MRDDYSYRMYEEKIKQILSPKRFYHSQCVANQAEYLASFFQADPKKAKLAGLLHDIAKEIPLENQLQRLITSAILVPIELQDNPPVWHGFTGSIILENDWKVTDKEILSAVKYHTCGKANMSGLELAVFVADYTSEDREYKTVECVRRLIPEKPFSAVFEGFIFGIHAALKNKKLLLSDSVEGYNYYKKLSTIEKGKGKTI